MNKNITLSFFLFLFCFANINAQNLLKICIKTELDEQLEQVEFAITGNADITQINNAAGCYQFEIGNAPGTFSITPSKDINHLNGVDVADLITIRKHVVGADLMSPFQVVSCDLNNSAVPGSNNSLGGGLTTFDMVLLHQSILKKTTLPINLPSWIFFDPDNVSGDFVTIVNNFQAQAPLNGDWTVNLLAVKSGDANVSANPVMFDPIPVYDLAEKLTFRTDDLSYNANDEFEVAFTADNFIDILGFQNTVKFDEDKMEFLEIESGDIITQTASFNLLFHNDEFENDGIINILWGNMDILPITLNMDDVIFTLKFKAKEDLQISEVLNFNSVSTFDIGYNLNEESMEVILLFGEPTSNDNLIRDLVKFENYPNPFQTTTQIEFNLPSNEYVKLEITDALGRLVETLVDGLQATGKHQIIFAPKHLPSGVYWSRLTIGENILTQKIIKM